MRILHVTDCYLPRLGGIEMHVSDLAARQSAAGHDVAVLTGTPEEVPSGQGAVQVERIHCGPLALRAGSRVHRYAVDNAVDVVHAHLSVASPLAWAALRTIHGRPAVATVHSVLPDSPALIQAGLAVTRFPTRSVAITAVSNAAAAPLRRAMGDRMPVQILPNGIDPFEWRGGHDSGNGSTFTVVSVGRFAWRKRQRALVRLLADLRPQLPAGTELRAILVGDGAKLGAIRAEVRRAGLADCVQLPGALTRAEIRGVLAQADVYVAPAMLESFGIAALEARCAGVPVVAMKQGGVGEFIADGREGFLVRDDAGMLAAVRTLAVDRGLRERIQRHNETTLPPMAWSSVIAQHDDVYARVLSRRGSQVPLRTLG